MKTLVAFLLTLSVAVAQDRNVSSLISTNNSVAIWGRSYASGVTDTTAAFEVSQFKTLYVNVESLDSATILIDYALSIDGSNYSAFAVKDSLSHGAAGNGVKSVDFTSTVLGFPYVKFRFRTSALAFPLGTTSPTYYASYSFKRR